VILGNVKNPSFGLVDLVKHGDRRLTIVTRPYPLATVEVIKVGPYEWTVRLISDFIPGRGYTYGSEDSARVHGSAMAVRRANAMWREGGPFSGQQRYAVSRGQCPYWLRNRACGVSPEEGSVWCPWHPKGRRIEVGE
jgi:hypothetical protein